MHMSSLEQRVHTLETKIRRDRVLAGVALALALCLSAASRETPATITARRILVVDDEGRTRIVLGQDPKDTQRRSRACGITLHDATGAERFGVGTMDDLSVTMGFDAPAGVGHAMRDRIGLAVSPDGSARIDLIDNRTFLPVRLVSEAEGGGGVEFFDYDLPNKKCTVTRLNSKGEEKRVLPLGDGE